MSMNAVPDIAELLSNKIFSSTVVLEEVAAIDVIMLLVKLRINVVSYRVIIAGRLATVVITCCKPDFMSENILSSRSILSLQPKNDTAFWPIYINVLVD